MALCCLQDHRKRHLFLASQDVGGLHFTLAEALRRPNVMMATFGPGGIPIPSLNTMRQLQPSMSTMVPSQERNIYVLAAFGERCGYSHYLSCAHFLTHILASLDQTSTPTGTKLWLHCGILASTKACWQGTLVCSAHFCKQSPHTLLQVLIL